MNYQFIEKDSDAYNAFREHITKRCDYKYVKFGDNYLVPHDAIILAFFKEGKPKTLENLKGAVVVSNWIPEYQTAELTAFQLDPSFRLYTPDIFTFVFDYLFEHMKLRKVNALVSMNNIPMRAALEHQGWNCIVNPYEYGPEEHELHYFYFKEQWDKLRQIYKKGN